MQTYSVTFINNSQNMGAVCLYQQIPGAPPDFMSLAWFARNAYPSTQVTFQWTVDYSFVWSQTGTLMPGITFQAGQQYNADPNGASSITLNQQYGSLQFSSPQSGAQPGTLAIQCAPTVPFNTASVGIGMSGSATFATQAYPNMTNSFTTNNSYWLTFGNYQQGQVLDAESIVNAAALDFGGGNALRVTLNPDGTYTIQAQ